MAKREEDESLLLLDSSMINELLDVITTRLELALGRTESLSKKNKADFAQLQVDIQRIEFKLRDPLYTERKVAIADEDMRFFRVLSNNRLSSPVRPAERVAAQSQAKRTLSRSHSQKATRHGESVQMQHIKLEELVVRTPEKVRTVGNTRMAAGDVLTFQKGNNTEGKPSVKITENPSIDLRSSDHLELGLADELYSYSKTMKERKADATWFEKIQEERKRENYEKELLDSFKLERPPKNRVKVVVKKKMASSQQTTDKQSAKKPDIKQMKTEGRYPQYSTAGAKVLSNTMKAAKDQRTQPTVGTRGRNRVETKAVQPNRKPTEPRIMKMTTELSKKQERRAGAHEDESLKRPASKPMLSRIVESEVSLQKSSKFKGSKLKLSDQKAAGNDSLLKNSQQNSVSKSKSSSPSEREQKKPTLVESQSPKEIGESKAEQQKKAREKQWTNKQPKAKLDQSGSPAPKVIRSNLPTPLLIITSPSSPQKPRGNLTSKEEKDSHKKRLSLRPSLPARRGTSILNPVQLGVLMEIKESKGSGSKLQKRSKRKGLEEDKSRSKEKSGKKGEKIQKNKETILQANKVEEEARQEDVGLKKFDLEDIQTPVLAKGGFNFPDLFENLLKTVDVKACTATQGVAEQVRPLHILSEGFQGCGEAPRGGMFSNKSIITGPDRVTLGIEGLAELPSVFGEEMDADPMAVEVFKY